MATPKISFEVPYKNKRNGVFYRYLLRFLLILASCRKEDSG
jgi:hypothetical protein